MAYRYKVTIVKNVAGFSGGAPNRGTSSSLLPYGGVHTHDFDLYKVVVLTRPHSTHIRTHILSLSLSPSSARRKEVDDVRLLEEEEEDPFYGFAPCNLPLVSSLQFHRGPRGFNSLFKLKGN